MGPVCSEIARHLNDEGIPSKRGGEWHPYHRGSGAKDQD
jgi:hypothetical protein